MPSSARDDYPIVPIDDDDRAQYHQMTAEIDRLRRWKAEATEVLAAWDATYETLGCPGRLGQSKAAAVRDMFAHPPSEVT